MIDIEQSQLDRIKQDALDQKTAVELLEKSIETANKGIDALISSAPLEHQQTLQEKQAEAFAILQDMRTNKISYGAGIEKLTALNKF